jgi:membrane protein YdbS with pleckstrin-like domain
MRLGPQPRRARGTVGHPYSALNLRLVLASFGLVTCAVLSGLMFAAHYWVAGSIVAVLAAIAVVDLIVIQSRRRARRRSDPNHHSLFE